MHMSLMAVPVVKLRVHPDLLLYKGIRIYSTPTLYTSGFWFVRLVLGQTTIFHKIG